MERADKESVTKFFEKYVKIKSFPLKNIDPGKDGVDLIFTSKLTTSQKKTIKNEVSNLLGENFLPSYEIMDIVTTDDEDEEIDPKTGKFALVRRYFHTLSIKVQNSAGQKTTVDTAIQEAGAAYVMTQVLNKNKKFDSPSAILQDEETNRELTKLFSGNKRALEDWSYTYFEHQKAFFKKFQPNEWKVFEHQKMPFVKFLQNQCTIVKEKTPSGQLKNVGRYETWNPSDIWVVKNKTEVKRKIEKAIQTDGTATLLQLNTLLLELINKKELIGLSLKKILDKKSATFAYVNIDSKKNEFSNVEEITMRDIKFEIKTEETTDGMSQGAYLLFGKYTINVLKTASSGFSNLKYEAIIKGSGGRGGNAPVAIVQQLLKSRNPSSTFVNDNKKYPRTKDEFKKDKRNYEKMYNNLKGVITGSRKYEEFEGRIVSMFESNIPKKREIAQIKLMQLHFFSDALEKKKNDPEFWKDLLYLAIKRNISLTGKRFAPHGKLA